MKNIGMILILLGLSAGGFVPSAAASDGLMWKEVTKDIYVAQTIRGEKVENTGVVVGKNSVLLVDLPSHFDRVKSLLDKIRSITPLPIGYVILTEDDEKHVERVALLPEDVKVITQIKTFERWDHLPEEDIPHGVRLDQGKLFLSQDGRIIYIMHPEPSLSDNDIWVHLPREGIVFAGTLFDPDPRHWWGDSSLKAWCATATEALKLKAIQAVPRLGDLKSWDEAGFFVALAKEVTARADEEVRSQIQRPNIEEIIFSEFRSRWDDENQLKALVHAAVKEAYAG